MKVIIAGGRTFDNYDLLKEKCDAILTKRHVTEIVSGNANGADKLGERYANENQIPVTKFPADWPNHGKAAGPIRNRRMAEYADMLIAFWDGKSRGTANMIKQAKAYELEVVVINSTLEGGGG